MSNPWALITGATGGLGSVLSKKFWDSGWNLILVSRKNEALETLISNLGVRQGQTALSFMCDLRNEVEVLNLTKKITQDVNSLEALINNAAIHGSIGPLETLGVADWKDVFQVNLNAPVMLCKFLLPLLKRANSGSIVNISGGGGTGPRPNFAAYSASKTALIRFSETFSKEVQASGVRVNCVSPGVMNTGLLKEVLVAGIEGAGELEVLGAMKAKEGSSSTINNAVELIFYLACDKSRGITGKTISAAWDNWKNFTPYISMMADSDLFTLRRIAGRDRNFPWADK